jgi:MoxR-like ATPase
MSDNKVKLEHLNPEIQNVGIEEFKEAIRDSVVGAQDINPLLVWGAPGIGKTAIIEDVAKEFFGENAKEQRRIVDYDLMTMAPEDFFLPTVQGKTESGDIGPDTRAVRVPDAPLPLYKVDDPDGDAKANGPDGKGGIIFFDEIARCSTAVQNVCLKLINERRIGDWILGSKWVMVAAANREGDEESGSYRFTPVLGNRFRQINYSPKFEDWNNAWAAHAMDKDGDFVVQREILAFIRFNHDKYFYNLDPEIKSSVGGSNTIFASPRSWTNASKALRIREKRSYDSGRRLTDDQREGIIASQVGKAAASGFIGFLKMMRKIDVNQIKAVYSSPKKAPTFKGLQLDEKNALIASVVFYKSKEEINNDEQENFVNWLILLSDAPFSIKAMSMIQEVHPKLKESDFWENDLKSKLFDAYPGLMGGRD